MAARRTDQTRPTGGNIPWVSVDEKLRDVVPPAIWKQGEPFDARLLYQTDKYLFLDRGGRILRVRNEDVRLLDLERQMAVSNAAWALRPQHVQHLLRLVRQSRQARRRLPHLFETVRRSSLTTWGREDPTVMKGRLWPRL